MNGGGGGSSLPQCSDLSFFMHPTDCPLNNSSLSDTLKVQSSVKEDFQVCSVLI